MLSKFYTCWFGIWTDRSGVMASDIFHTCCNTRSLIYVGHRQIFDIVPPHTHRQTYRQTDILNVPEL